MTVRGLNNKNYSLSKEIGKGGEGVVYSIGNEPNLVAKLYNDVVAGDKLAKLSYMVSIRNPQIETYAAWPIDVIRNDADKRVGFIMKKLDRYAPLHMLFSPMDRKRLFPDKGYNFLVHVARNLSAAFNQLHSAGIIVGDVNEGNILVNNTGMIGFIDCDSFQIRNGSKYYYCEVGVSRYTPPELLRKGTFENVVRTASTDGFSLGVLLFQLLFLGRHPFAGKNNTAADIDEETAIKTYQFSFSLKNTHKQLSPPNDAVSIASIAPELSDLFHRSFEHENNRPVPSDWVRPLDEYAKSMIFCKTTRLHTYYNGLKECPWCDFRSRRGIMYFLDDSYLKGLEELNDIESFVNGFRLEPINIEPLAEGKLASVQAAFIDKKFYRYKVVRNFINLLALLTITLFFIYQGLLLVPIVLFFFNYIAPWSTSISQEFGKRKKDYTQLKEKYQGLIKDYNNVPDLTTYNKNLIQFQSLIAQFRDLPNELQKRKRMTEERIYAEQLSGFLNSFDIRDYQIPSFGATRKLTLYNNGIRTANDISKLNSIKIQGIGPKIQSILEVWQRQVASKFVYKPDGNKLRVEFQRQSSEVTVKKTQLESYIRQNYQSMHSVKTSIGNRQNVLKRQIADIAGKYFQAEADFNAFKKI